METEEEAIEDNHKWMTVANNNRYNLRPRPTKRNNKYTLLQNGQNQLQWQYQTTCTHHADTNEGSKRFSEKGNKALLKELNQLHQWEALLPVNRHVL